MTRSDARVQHALALALTAGFTASCSEVRGTRPEGLSDACSEGARGAISVDASVDYWATRVAYASMTAPDGVQRSTTYEWGDACAGASDQATCLDALDNAWPEFEPGCEESDAGCWSSAWVATQGDIVEVYPTAAEFVDLVLPVDSVGDVVIAGAADGYSVECSSIVVRGDGHWRMRAHRSTGECPIIHHPAELEITADGDIEVLRTLDSIDTETCIGRRPTGLHDSVHLSCAALGERLARMAWLEGAAVAAFEQLGADLARLGAPASLVARAARAASDERRHARRVGRLARRYGAEVAAVTVDAVGERSVLDIALENATEGCVRETFGVADASWRAVHASTPDLRGLFRELASDETRHAQLSWDVAQWALTRLDEAQTTQVRLAMQEAEDQLRSALAQQTPDPAKMAMGAPSATVAVAMLDALTERLAA